MSVTKDDVLNTLIGEFEALQAKYRELGARDTEPDGHFQWVIARALEGKPVNWGQLEWELYSGPGSRAAAQALTRQAQKVYAHIEAHGKLGDLQALRGYCWRITF
jgi:hypothetical protein